MEAEYYACWIGDGEVHTSESAYPIADAQDKVEVLKDGGFAAWLEEAKE